MPPFWKQLRGLLALGALRWLRQRSGRSPLRASSRAPPQGVWGSPGALAWRQGAPGPRSRSREAWSRRMAGCAGPTNTLDVAQCDLCTGTWHLVRANTPPLPRAHPTCHKRILGRGKDDLEAWVVGPGAASGPSKTAGFICIPLVPCLLNRLSFDPHFSDDVD